MSNSDIISPPVSRRPAMLLIIVVFLAGMVLRFTLLGNAEYSTDEELSTGLSQLGYGDLFGNLAGRPPLAFLFQKVAVDLSGSVAPAILRLPSVIEGCLGMLALLILTWRRVSPATGIVALSLMAFSSFHFELSRDARYYPLLFLCCTVALDAYLGFFLRGSWRALPLLVVASCAAAMTHYSAFLLLAAFGLMAPPLLLGGVWRERFTRHPGCWALAGGILVLSGVVAIFLLRPFLEVPLGHLAWPRADRKLTPLFDIRPAFLFAQFTLAFGVSKATGLLALACAAVGICTLSVRRATMVAVLTGVVFLPFLLLYLFPFEHWWTPKYFVYMLAPLYLFVAAGITSLGAWAGRLPGRPGRIVSWAIPAALVALIALPNLSAMGDRLRMPLNPHRQLGTDLTAWTRPGETVFTSWRERQRVLRHYFDAAGQGVQLAFLSTQTPFPYVLPQVPRRWYVATGKVEVHPPYATLMLSERFSRVAYHEFFLASGPNPQRVTFGETFPGYPTANDPLMLPPGASVPLDILIPRAGERAVYAEFTPATTTHALEIAVHEGDQRVGGAGMTGSYSRLGQLDLQRGRTRFQLMNPASDDPVTVTALEMVPTLGEAPVLIPAWDFYAMDGGESLATVWPEDVGNRVVLRDMRRGHTAYYRFEARQTALVVIRLFALNDPPGANDYQLHLVGAGLTPMVLSFDAADGDIGYRDTPAFELPAGVHTLAVTYLGLPAEAIQKSTDNFRVMTRARLQNPGLERIELYNVGSR